MADPTAYDVLHKRLDAFSERMDKIHDDAEAVHQTRVASRRLRELLPLTGLKADTAGKLTRRLKRVTRALGAVREVDVLLQLIEDFSRDTRYPSKALARVGAAVSESRDGARKRLAAKLPVPKLRRLAGRIERAVKRRSRLGQRPKQGWMWATDARVARRAASLAQTMEAAGALYDPARLHDVRIALKKLRYAMELIVEARQAPETGDIATLKEGQDLLGRLSDVELMVARTRQWQSAQSPPDLTVSRDVESLLRTLERECRALHARYMHHRSKLAAVVNRITRPDASRRPAARGRLG